MNRQDLALLAQTCLQIGDTALDDGGFVPIRNLVNSFRAKLIARPLLVEAMIATVSQGNGDRTWAVLIDSETSGITAENVDSLLRSERRGSTLPPRTRNTIAHELAHSLAFRPSDFGLRLVTELPDAQSRAQFIEEVERVTESLSPLLLLPTRCLKSWLTGHKQIDVQALRNFQQEMGVSRHVLVSRLTHLQSEKERHLLHLPSLSDLAVGVGEWGPSSVPLLRKWPLFLNFERNLAPAFLLRLTKGKDKTPLKDLAGDTSEAERLIQSVSQSVCLPAGTIASPNAAEMDVSIHFEEGERASGSSFFYVVRGRLRKAPVQSRFGRPT